MRAHTASGTGPFLALAPAPTAGGFVGKRIRGSAPATGTGASLVLAGGVACVGDPVLVLDGIAVVGAGMEEVLPALDAVDIGVDVDRAAVEDPLLASPAAGEPATQPARVRVRQVRALTAVAGLTVALGRIVGSVRLTPGRSESATVRRIVDHALTNRPVLYAESSDLPSRWQRLGIDH